MVLAQAARMMPIAATIVNFLIMVKEDFLNMKFP
jgi:hypothetical protein